eukprot:81665-Prymnesium_polylepis.1
MLVLQRRRKSVECGTGHSLSSACFSDVEAHTAAIHPDNQYWHRHSARAHAYILPVDLGRMGVIKDSGRCSIARETRAGQTPPRTPHARAATPARDGPVCAHVTALCPRDGPYLSMPIPIPVPMLM